MNKLSSTGIAVVVLLAVAAYAVAQAPDAARAERKGAQGKEWMQRDMPHPAGGHMGMGDEPSRESMLARFITNDEIAKKLGLTEAQIETLKTCGVELRKKAIRLKAEQELAGMAQVELLSAEELNEAAIMAAVEKSGRIRTEIAKLQIQPIIELKKTLTAEQLAEAKKMLHERMRQRMQAEGAPQWRHAPRGEGEGNQDREGPPPELRRPPRGEERGDRDREGPARERPRMRRGEEGPDGPQDGPPPAE